MTLKKLGLTRAFALSLCVAAVGCVGSDEDRPSKDVVPTEVAPVGADTVGTERVMGRYRATYTAGKGLSFAPIAPTGPTVTPQGFRLDTGSLFTFATTAGTDGAGPNAVYGDCGATQVCAQVAVQVGTAVTGDTQGDVWVSVTDLDPTGLTIANSDTPPGGSSPLAPVLAGGGGRFNYGTLTDGVDAVKRWNFSLPAGFDPANDNFSFNVEVYASFHVRSDVGYSKVDLAGPLTPLDACVGGTQRLSVNDDDQVSTTFALPWVTHMFRFSSYNSGTGANSNIWVSENGTFGIGPASTSSTNQRLSLFPFGLTRGAVAVFWQDLVFADLDPADPSGAVGEVCSLISGTLPNRKLTITWKNMEITNAGARTGNLITFSSVLHEGTDIIEFHYNKPTDTTLPGGRGGFATIGIQASDPAGTTGASRQIAHKSATFLPDPTVFTYPFGTSLVPN